MMGALVEVDTSARGVLTITLASPATRNALSLEMLEQLRAALARGEGDDVLVIVLRATGPSFSAGADLKAVERDGMAGILREIAQVQREILASSKPIVARVHGSVRAGGIGIVGAADIAVGSTQSTFAFTETRLALAPAVIGLTVIPRLTNRAAVEWMLTGATFDGTIAEANGLLTTAVEESDLDEATHSTVEELLKTKTQGTSTMKRILNAPVLRNYDEQVDAMLATSSKLFASKTARAAVASVLEAHAG